MRPETRAKFNAYVSRIALLNRVELATQQFNVDPVIDQRLVEKLKENSDFLGMISIETPDQQLGQTLGLEATRPIMGRKDTSGGARRDPTDPSGNSEINTYNCQQTNFDWSRRYAQIDMWRHRPEFETLVRDAILKQQARDLIMAGWNGTHVAATTNIVTYPNLEDAAEGWLFKIGDRAPAQVFSDGNLTVKDDGSNNAALHAIYIKPGVELFDPGAAYGAAGGSAHAVADYSSLDALVLDLKGLLPTWHRTRTDLVVIVGNDLIDDKLFTIAQETGATATEVEATDRILRSNKALGGLPAVLVPYFPADAVLITTLANLAIYNQAETRRRRLADEPEYDRIANYESVNMDYVVEDYDLVAFAENIVIGGSPARVAH